MRPFLSTSLFRGCHKPLANLSRVYWNAYVAGNQKGRQGTGDVVRGAIKEFEKMRHVALGLLVFGLFYLLGLLLYLCLQIW